MSEEISEIQKVTDMVVTVIRTKRKTVSIQVNNDLSVTVRAPKWVAKKEIENILQKSEPWIQKHIDKIKKKKAEYEAADLEKLTNEEIRMLKDKALSIIPERVKYFSGIIGVDYGRITIRNQKTRWGSCSSKGNLSFNCLLMLTPPEVIDSIVVHELCHIRHMNHSNEFYNEILKYFPDYYKWNKWLKENGKYIFGRL